MKKIIISLLFCLFLSPLAAFSNSNFIYAINVSPDDISSGNIKLEVKSDYKTNVKNRIDEMGREYFDIKDASLKENFVIQYNNVNGVESVIAQQIGNKVRIYVNGSSIKNVTVNFNNVESQPYPDKSAGYALLVFAFAVCALLGIFKRKAKNIKTKALKNKIQTVKNTASKTVYTDLMKRRALNGANRIYDNRNLTLNSLNKRRENIAKSNISGAMNARTIEEQQRLYSARAKVAM